MKAAALLGNARANAITSPTRIVSFFMLPRLSRSLRLVLLPVQRAAVRLPQVALYAPACSATNASLIAGIVAAIAVGAATLGGAVWYGRRRVLR